MNHEKTGKLISTLRKGKGYTQQQLADLLLVSPKTVSKWETAAGYPDISIIPRLAELLEVTAEQLLSGEERLSIQTGGSMKRLQFYCCETCGNVVTSTGEATISCCGRKLSPLQVQPMDERHDVQIEEMDDDTFVTVSHSMEKEHYISFVAWVRFDRFSLVRLYPEQNAELHIQLPRKGTLYVYCSKDGLFQRKL